MIKIAARLKPFSHQPGATCLLPKSNWQIQAFPVLLRFKNLYTKEEIELKLALKGPIKDFTLEQDLEKGIVRVFGHAPLGYLCINIVQEIEGMSLCFEKVPSQEMQLMLSNAKTGKVKRGDKLLLAAPGSMQTLVSQERLSLEMHKMQDWDLVQRRCDLREIFPIWHRLGQWLPQQKTPASASGMMTLLKTCEEAILSSQKKEIVPSFVRLFLAAFHGILTPRLFDDEFQGLVDDTPIDAKEISPLFLVKDGAALIRALFFQESKDRVSLLPALPPEFHAGRFINIECQNQDQIDLEWTKKSLRRVIYRPKDDRTIHLQLPKSIQSFRLKRALKERGIVIKKDEPLILNSGETLYLDRFQK